MATRGGRTGGRGGQRAPAVARARPQRERRERRPRERRGRSELGARVAVAIPAGAFAVTIISLGGIWFTLAAIVLAILCLGELFDLYAEVEPVRLAGFLGVAGLGLAAYFADDFHVLLVAMAIFPVLFVVTLAQRQAGTLGMAITIFGVAWIGLSSRRHPVAGVPPAARSSSTCRRHVHRRHRRLPRRALVRPAQARAERVAEQDRRGPPMGCSPRCWRRGWPAPQDWLSGTDAILLGIGVAIAAPLGDLFESFVERDAGVGHRPPCWCPRRWAGPPRRRHVHGRRRLPLSRCCRDGAARRALDGRVPRRLLILGWTGSIGTQALEIVARDPELEPWASARSARRTR